MRIKINLFNQKELNFNFLLIANNNKAPLFHPSLLQFHNHIYLKKLYLFHHQKPAQYIHLKNKMIHTIPYLNKYNKNIYIITSFRKQLILLKNQNYPHLIKIISHKINPKSLRKIYL